MKICYLGDTISIHNQKWIKALSERNNVELHVISFNRGVMFENVEYHYLKEYTKSKADYIFNVKRVCQLVSSIQPDILHAHYASSWGYMGSMCNFHPYIITGWGADIFDSTKNPILKRIIKRSFSKADALTVLSKITQDEMKKLTDKEVELIPFGVDTKKFIPVQKNHPGIIRIGTFRTLKIKYGVEYLIRAFAVLAQKFPNITLEIVGDGELREALENLGSELGVSDKITFHGFINQQTDFTKYSSVLSQLDIFAILSIMDSETFGVACVEASACGIPVVATNVGGLPEVIKDGITGIIVEPKNPDQTACALEKLLVDESLRIKMGEAGRRNVIDSFDWEKSVEKMMNVYTKVLNRSLE